MQIAFIIYVWRALTVGQFVNIHARSSELATPECQFEVAFTIYLAGAGFVRPPRIYGLRGDGA
mgnify:CR=1 FL=1